MKKEDFTSALLEENSTAQLARDLLRDKKQTEENLTPLFARIPSDLYEEYKELANIKGVNLKDLLLEAMRSYGDYLENKDTLQKIRKLKQK